MSIKDRILSIRVSLKETQEGFGASIGITKQGLAKIEKGLSAPSWGVLEAIAAKCPTINFNWLVKGEGEMWEKEKPAGSESIRVENNQIGNNVNVQQLLGGCEKEVARLKREIQLLEEINQLLKNQK
jgi:DNA-binding XRE family transcriptional regulator